MSRASTSKIPLRQQVQKLEQEHQQTQRALDVLYRVGLACRGLSDPKELLVTIYTEMQTIWRFDAFYIALCDEQRQDKYRLALLVDENEQELLEDVEIGTLTSYIIEKRTPLLFTNLVEERTKFGLPPATIFGSDKLSRSWMGVPLLIGQDATGVISIQSYQIAEYSNADLDLLQRVASSMAIVLENATLTHRQAELGRSLAEQVALRNADLFVISDIAAMLTQQQHLAVTFGLALEFLLQALDVQWGVISEYRASEHHVVASQGLALPQLRAMLNDQLTSLGAAIRQQRVATLEVATTTDLTLDHLAHILVAPLLRSNMVIGTLLVGKSEPQPFKESEVELLQVVANQLALALEQSILLQQRDRQIAELEALRRITYVAGRSLETPPLLREIHDALQTVVPIDVFYMAIYDIERNVITQSMAIEGGKIEQYHDLEVPPIAGSFTEWVLRQRTGLFIEHVSTQLEQYPGIQVHKAGGASSESWMGVPLFDLMQQPIGLISIQSYTPYAFSTRDRQFLQAVANQVGLHVRNVQLFRQRERQLAESNALQRISELTSSTLDIVSMISSIDEVLKSFLGVDGFFIVLIETQNKTIEGLFILEGGQTVQADEFIGKTVPPKTPTSWILEHGKSLRFDDIITETVKHPEIEPSQITETNPAAWLGVPILNRDGAVMGALVIQSYRSNQFSAHDEQFMLQVGRQLSMSIQNARLFAERERQLKELDALQRISELVNSTLELQRMIRSIDEILREFLQADAFQVVIVDLQSLLVEVAIVIEQGEDIPSQLAGKILPQATFTHWTLSHAQPLRLGNIHSEWHVYEGLTQPSPIHPDGRPKPSWLSVPMLQDDVPLGVLAVRAYRPRAFNEKDERFLMSVAHQLSMSIRNAHLFQAEQKAHRTAETLREIARVLNTSFNPDEVLSLILHELKQVINYDSASIMLPLGNKLRIVARQSEIDDGDHWRELNFDIAASNGAGRVMLSQQPLLIHDTVQEDQWISSPMPYIVRSWIGVPLINKGVVLGVLNINALLPYAFSSRSVDIAMTFANQAATALEHARLYQESVTRVEQELEIAHQIQSNLFPKQLPQIPGTSLAGLCIPARETGGDFFELLSLSDDLWGIVVGDVSGKSIPAAMLMAVARSVVRSEAWDHQHPEIVMAETNRWIHADIPRSSFIAMLYATYQADTRMLSLSNAGQLEPIRIRAAGDLEYLSVPNPRLPLGIDPEIGYKTATYYLEVGDKLILYTDGIVEAQNDTGELWGFERFEATLQTLTADQTPQASIDHILEEVRAFTGTEVQHDDITLMIITIEPR